MHPAFVENTDICLASTAEQISSCYELVLQLRPHLKEPQAFIDQVQRQQAEGYRLAYIEENGHVKALIGFRFLEFLAWGKVLYIDDLVTDSKAQKSGHGGRLLKWTMEQAKQSRCDQVHLDSGPQRHDAHRLYLNHGFKIIGYHFAKSRS
jgi:GNAT superfamily N-acetyltransferase